MPSVDFTSNSALLTEAGQCIVVGNPNVGKSVIFGHLSRQYVVVSNYPGTTITFTKGWMKMGDKAAVRIIDTPGINNLLPNSEDEMVTRNILVSASPSDKIIQVLDTKNLARGLFITLQISEMGLSGLMALNMWDEARLRGYEVDHKRLSEVFGVPCVPTIAIHNRGLRELKRNEGARFKYQLKYHAIIERALIDLSEFLPALKVSIRSLGLMVLSGEKTFLEFLKEKVSPSVMKKILAIREETAMRVMTDLRLMIDSTRMAEADRIARMILSQVQEPQRRRIWNGLEKTATHPIAGFGLLAGVLFLMYQFVGVLGAGTLVDLLENKFFNTMLNPVIIQWFDRVLPFPHLHNLEQGIMVPGYVRMAAFSLPQEVFRFIHDFFVGEYGAVTMALTYGLAIIFPVVATFFLAFGLLEDLGYLPRLSILLNGLFKKIGLNGKAVLPMVLGLGCDTMATLTARILDTKKERLITTFLLALAVPCSAQLAVILFLLQGGVGLRGVLIWASIVILVLFAAGFLASKLIKGDASPLIMEVPPLRLPSLRNIVIKTFARMEWYLKEVIPIFLLGTAMLFILNEIHFLGVLERMMRPLVTGWLGLPSDAAEAILMGFFRRDYGAAGFIRMFEEGSLSKSQILVGVTTITLFVPCIANALVIIKERGIRTSFKMFVIVLLVAFGTGGLLHRILLWRPL